MPITKQRAKEIVDFVMWSDSEEEAIRWVLDLATAPANRKTPSLTDGPMHLWFGLSYASYLTLPRSLIQSMPNHWQRRLVRLLEQFGETFPGADLQYTVKKRKAGKFESDPLADYRRPDEAAIKRCRKAK